MTSVCSCMVCSMSCVACCIDARLGAQRALCEMSPCYAEVRPQMRMDGHSAHARKRGFDAVCGVSCAERREARLGPKAHSPAIRVFGPTFGNLFSEIGHPKTRATGRRSKMIVICALHAAPKICDLGLPRGPTKCEQRQISELKRVCYIKQQIYPFTPTIRICMGPLWQCFPEFGQHRRIA